MAIVSEPIELPVQGQTIAGTLLSPSPKLPGVLFVHGWGGSQQRDLGRAESITGLGCVCLTFDLRGHARTEDQRQTVNREQSLTDVLTAYDRLVSHPDVDPESIAVVGSSYGGYLAALLTAQRRVRWLALRVPALYWDKDWELPKAALNREGLAHYRRTLHSPADNRALAACGEFAGDVLLVESQHDDYVPHETVMSYRSAFVGAHSLTHRIIDGADHGLTQEAWQKAYSTLLGGWVSEMIVGSRLENYPHHSAVYS
ncbi:alpha/beta hydrolase family protein [Pseudomonas massiliensis]|uniref:alpha/beta hydrolase family protein n=1 Tax=Pseudomonas massiliensis TaxID=522492 RepID=UPI00058EE081|nr:alpha/beta fold hydrolase [Pseudomonas massiliensis]